MAITSERFHQALRIIDAAAIQGYKHTPPIFPTLFKPMRHRQSDHVEVAEFGGLDRLVEKAPLGAVAFQTPSPGFSKYQQFVEYALALQFSKTFVQDEKMGAMAGYVKRLAQCVPRTQEWHAAQAFNSGDTTDYHTCSDGLALFANTHQLVKGGPANYDTLATAASLNATSLQAALNQIDTRVDEFGLPIDEDPTYIVFHPNLQWKVAELLRSTHSPEDSRRAINPIHELTNLKPIKWKYLSSQTAWFIVCRSEQTGLRFVLRSPLETQRSGDFLTSSLLFKAYIRYLFLVWHPRGTLANIP